MRKKIQSALTMFG